MPGSADPLLTYSTTGLMPADSAASILSGTLGRAPGEAAGSYPIARGTLALMSANYTMSFVPASFTIASPVTATPAIVNALMNQHRNSNGRVRNGGRNSPRQ